MSYICKFPFHIRGILYLAIIKSNIPKQKKMEYIFRYHVGDFRVHIVEGEIGKIEKK